MGITFYDLTGRAVAYTEDNENIYLYSGLPVAYLFGNLVYSFRGTQLGRFENGWIRDKNGFCVFFKENARGKGPIKPTKHISPVKGLKQLKPLKGIRQIPSAKRVDNLSWSNMSGERFFVQ